MDLFSRAVDAMFRAPGSIAVNYFVGSGGYLSVRIILGQPDQTVLLGRGKIVESGYAVSIRRSEVAKPVPGDVVRFTDRTVGRGDEQVTGLKIYGEPLLDVEGLTWSCIGAPVE